MKKLIKLKLFSKVPKKSNFFFDNFSPKFFFWGKLKFIFLDLDDLDKYMLELHRKDRQFADLVPEPEAQNDQEFFPQLIWIFKLMLAR